MAKLTPEQKARRSQALKEYWEKRRAAKMVAESGRTDIAALSSRECADLYNLKILENNVQVYVGRA